jgi:hypothetical protein
LVRGGGIGATWHFPQCEHTHQGTPASHHFFTLFLTHRRPQLRQRRICGKSRQAIQLIPNEMIEPATITATKTIDQKKTPSFIFPLPFLCEQNKLFR